MVPLRAWKKMTAAAFVLALAAAPSGNVLSSEPTMAGAQSSAADADEGRLERGRALFASWSCGDCHILADAGAMGPIGPSLDGNPNLSYDFIIARITDGQGAMPPFGGQLNDEEIAELSAYILLVAEK